MGWFTSTKHSCLLCGKPLGVPGEKYTGIDADGHCNLGCMEGPVPEGAKALACYECTGKDMQGVASLIAKSGWGR
jgi:hypothetical protein